jgi:hypothetical protein
MRNRLARGLCRVGGWAGERRREGVGADPKAGVSHPAPGASNRSRLAADFGSTRQASDAAHSARPARAVTASLGQPPGAGRFGWEAAEPIATTVTRRHPTCDALHPSGVCNHRRSGSLPQRRPFFRPQNQSRLYRRRTVLAGVHGLTVAGEKRRERSSVVQTLTAQLARRGDRPCRCR